MLLIIGLGNPGKKYIKTRHNAGFMALDKLQKSWDFPDFKMEKKFNAEISKNSKIILVKPQTFMNDSGASIRAFLDFYKLTSDDILVIHDDLDISLGKYKIAQDSRSAGHNGVQNIIDALGTQKFRRLRIGIAKPPEEKKSCPISGHDYVLGKFSSKEIKVVEKVLEEVLEEIKKIAT